MSKTFRELVEALKKREENPEGDQLKPRGAEGEVEFADQQDYPAKNQIGGAKDKAYPAKGSDDVVNARKAKATDKHNPPIEGGDKKFPEQGTSRLSNKSGFTGKQSNTRANAAAVAGDKSVVRTSPSAVQPMHEDVTSQLERIAHAGAPANVKFRDGDVTKVNPDVAQHMLSTFHQLKPDNATKFKESINKDATGFLKMMKFAKA